MKQGLFTHANAQPLEIEIKHLFGNTFEISAASNITEVEIERPVHGEEETTETTTEFQYDLYITTAHITGYEELVSALVELKYTHGDEISLMRKGISNKRDTEYADYIGYVESCKAAAKNFYGIE